MCHAHMYTTVLVAAAVYFLLFFFCWGKMLLYFHMNMNVRVKKPWCATEGGEGEKHKNNVNLLLKQVGTHFYDE